MTNLFCGECCDYPKSKKKSFLWGDIVQIAMLFHQSHVQFNEKRLLLEKLKLMAIFLTVYSYKSYSSLHFSKESLNYSGKCLPASVMSHICHLFQTPPKKRIVKIKPELKVVLTKGASKPILLDDTHNEPENVFLFFQVPHTTQQQQSNVEDCHRLTEMFSLNFPFRKIFVFWSAR